MSYNPYEDNDTNLPSQSNETFRYTERINETKHLKKYLRQLIAVCCALSLLFGATGGAILGKLTASTAAPVAQTELTSTDTGTTAQGDSSGTGGYTTTYATANSTGEMTTSQVAALMGDAVVAIDVQSESSSNYFNQTYTTTGSGSGVIIDSDGYIVTNNHVIEGASKITVYLKDGTEYEATLLGTDSQTDIALLKIDATGLTAATLGDSDSLQVGETSIAIGNPLGKLSGTVTQGIISALDREIDLGDGTMNLLQTDAAVNPGNSGGALFNNSGELIGIVVAKTTATGVEGLGFAIPINDVKPILEQLRTYGYVTGRPALGLTVVEINDPMTAMSYRLSRLGVYISAVTDGSNAAKAGLQSGDCIVSIDGTEVTTVTEISDIISAKNVGDEVEISVLRDEQTISVKLALVEEGNTDTSL